MTIGEQSDRVWKSVLGQLVHCLFKPLVQNCFKQKVVDKLESKLKRPQLVLVPEIRPAVLNA